MNESELQRVYNYLTYTRDSKIFSEKGFVDIDDGRMKATYWTAFYVKNNNSFYYDSFGGQPDKFLLNQLLKTIIYHNYKTQDTNSKLCGSNCLNFFYLIERMKYYDTILKMYFETCN